MSKNGDDYSEKDAVLEYVASMNNSSDLRSGNYGCFIAPFNGKLSVLYGTLEEAKREFLSSTLEFKDNLILTILVVASKRKKLQNGLMN